MKSLTTKTDNKITISGIETNNLKNIDVTINKGGINLIVGPSGSGKTSLAYDTIAQIGQHEFMSMFADNISDPSYKVKTYSNMIPAVPIRQTNNNNNMRSTVGTYFGLNRYISLLYSTYFDLREDYFVLNKSSNLCERCHGLGTVKELDVNRIISFSVPLKEDPVRCWSKYKEFYKKIIVEYCKSVSIDPEKTFSQLTKKEKELFLSGESKDKYQIKFKKVNAVSSRTTKYYGVMLNKPLIPGANIADKFYSDVTCPCCNGQKYSSEHGSFLINDKSIGEYMMTPFADLIKFNNSVVKTNSKVKFIIDKLNEFINKTIELKIGYLSFNRAIPTLSGGELQRLRMVQLFNTQLTNLLIVLDEPLAGLSGKEKEAIYNCVIKLSEKHTIVVVDHSDAFLSSASNVIGLGEKSGKFGGYLIDGKQYLKDQSNITIKKPSKAGNNIDIELLNNIYLYKGIRLSISDNSLNLLTGSSGIGKSTLIREYLPQFFDEYTYVSQKPILGNTNSNVATLLDIANEIFQEFGSKYKKPKTFFSNNTGNDGCCPICSGAGFIEYGSDKDNIIKLECQECYGTGFNKDIFKYKINNKSILDIWKLTIDEAITYFKEFNKKITDKLTEASSIMLGHLQIGQPTSTLSGGENIRFRILKAKTAKSKIIGIDEPFRGLGNSEIHSVMMYLHEMISKGKTILVVEHNERAFSYFQRHITLENDNGILVGKTVFLQNK